MPAATAPQQDSAEDAYETAMMRVCNLAERILNAFDTPPTGDINWGHVGSLNTAIDSLEGVALVVEQATR